MAKLADSEEAKIVIIPDWNGDMFLWGEFARKFNAFWTAVENLFPGSRGSASALPG